MSFEEWKSIIASLGENPVWITLSGGEPFLVEWIDKLIIEIAYRNKPELLVIPTNGLLPEVIEKKLDSALPYISSRDTSQVTINLSIDGIRERHDEIRGIRGNFERAIETVKILKELQKKFPLLSIGIHTVVSKWNVHNLEELIEFVEEEISPDQHIFEVAEVRGEMNNEDHIPTPSKEEFELFLKALTKLENKGHKRSWINKIIAIFRKRYYQFLRDILYENRQPIPSFASFASVQINSNGDVWDCAVHTNIIGNLRDYGFNFRNFWSNCNGVGQVQEKIKFSHICPLANEMYINMLFSPWRLLG